MFCEFQSAPNSFVRFLNSSETLKRWSCRAAALPHHPETPPIIQHPHVAPDLGHRVKRCNDGFAVFKTCQLRNDCLILKAVGQCLHPNEMLPIDFRNYLVHVVRGDFLVLGKGQYVVEAGDLGKYHDDLIQMLEFTRAKDCSGARGSCWALLR